MQDTKQQLESAVDVSSTRLFAELQDALSEYPKIPQEVFIGTDSPTDKVRWLCRRCDGGDRTISRLHKEKAELLQLLKSVHAWFMEKAPEHYNGCGLWIDVDMTLRNSAKQCIRRQPTYRTK